MTRRSTQAVAAARPLSWPAKAGLLALGALVIRLIYLWELRDTLLFSVLIGDGRQYDAWAQQISAGQWIGTDVFYQTPLYPYMLAVWFNIAGHHVFGARVIQAALGAASCAGLAAVGRRFFGDRAGLVAGMLLAIYPPAIFFDGLIQKSSLDLVLAVVLLACLGDCLERPRWWWLATAGAALGAFALNRENARLLYPVIIVWLLVNDRSVPLRRRVGWTVIVTAAAALVLLPVGLRNVYVGGEFLMSTSQFGPNFYIGNHTGAAGVYQPLVPGHGDPKYERADATALAERAEGRTLSPGGVSSYWTRRAIEDIAREPMAWLRLMGRKLLLVVNAKEVVDSESIDAYAGYSWLLSGLRWITFGLLFPLAVLGAWITRHTWRRLVVLWAMAAGLIGSVALFYVFARYRYPAVPILMLFAGAALALLFEARERRPPLPVVGVAMALMAAVLSHLPLDAGYDSTWLNLGAELVEAGRPAEAIPVLQKGIAQVADYAPLHLALGTAYSRAGQYQQAIEPYREALRLRPGLVEAESGLAAAYQATGQMTEALPHLAEAARLRPDDAAIHTRLALNLLQLGRLADAIPHFETALRLNPDAPGTLVSFALGLQQAGQVGAAIDHLREAVRLRPDDFAIRMTFGSVLAGAGRPLDAMEQYSRATQLAPSSIEAHALLGQAFAQAGKFSEAVVSLEQARSIARAAGDADAIQQIDTAIQVCRRQRGRN